MLPDGLHSTVRRLPDELAYEVMEKFGNEAIRRRAADGLPQSVPCDIQNRKFIERYACQGAERVVIIGDLLIAYTAFYPIATTIILAFDAGPVCRFRNRLAGCIIFQ